MNAVSAGHEVTQKVAVQILEVGGNAFDAAIAAYLASWIAEPCMSSAGGGAFANVYTADGRSMVFDFFCQTPQNKVQKIPLDFVPIHIDFGEAQEIYYGGLASMAVPGSIAGIFEIHKQLGTIPMKVLFEPAIQLAKEGVAINNFQHYDLSLLHSVFDHRKRAMELFKPNGQLINIGETLRLPELSDFLDFLWREGPDAFYQGEVAQNIVRDCVEQGGFLCLEDFKNYKTFLRKPVKSTFKDYQILSNPLPSTGGTLMTVGLDYLNQFETSKPKNLLSAFGNMNSFEKNPEKLGSFLESRNRRGATSHFNVWDKWGNAIALTMTIGEGSGYIVPGTDIHMNNMLGESSLVPNGWHSWKEDIRLSSMMNPTIVLNAKNELDLIIGSGGASRIPGAILQVLVNTIEKKHNVVDAALAPRIHYENSKLDIEPKYEITNEEIPKNLAHKFWKKQSMFFGGTHAIQKSNGKLLAVGDQRRDGVSVVF